MRYPRSVKIFRGQIDAAPFVGVMFLMVIFLLLHSHLVNPTGFEILLPESEDPQGIPGPHITLAVDAKGVMFFENQMIDEGRLRARLEAIVAQWEEPPVLLIQADRNLSLSNYYRLFDLAHESGFNRVWGANKRSAK